MSRLFGAAAACLAVMAAPVSALEQSYKKGHRFWTVVCYDDRIDDTRNCIVENGNLYAGVTSDGLKYIGVGREHYPGSTIAIRIDGGTPLKWREDKYLGAGRIEVWIDRLKKGSTALVRYRRWPENRNIDQEVTLTGFTAAYNDAERAAAAYRP